MGDKPETTELELTMSAKRKAATTEVAKLSVDTERKRPGRKPGTTITPKRPAIDVVRTVVAAVRHDHPAHHSLRLAVVDLALAITSQKGHIPSKDALVALAGLKDSDREYAIDTVHAAMAPPKPVEPDQSAEPEESYAPEEFAETEGGAVAA